MTLKEIAAEAGVSISTVSRIINSPDDSFARKEVRDKVWSIVRKTGYIPNQSARNLKKGRGTLSFASAISITCVLGRTRHLEENPFFAQVARAVEQQALDLGYAVQLSYSILDTEYSVFGEKALQSPSEGAIILGRFDAGMRERLERCYKNLVFVGRSPMELAWDQVICDGYEATGIALTHLWAYGHRRIAFIGETGAEVRYQAYLDFLKKQELEQEQKWIVSCPQNTADGGYQGAELLLRQAGPLPTAVFCATDVIAIAALRRFQEAGVQVPDQLSIISLDNIELSGYVSPMLTTVEMPIVEMGNLAVQVLNSRIRKQHKLALKLYLPNRLIVRESVANLNERLYI